MKQIINIFILITYIFLPISTMAGVKYPIKSLVLYHESTTIWKNTPNGKQRVSTTDGTGKSIKFDVFDDVIVGNGIDKFIGVEQTGVMIPTEAFLGFRDANVPEITYFSDLKNDNGDRVAISIGNTSYLFLTLDILDPKVKAKVALSTIGNKQPQSASPSKTIPSNTTSSKPTQSKPTTSKKQPTGTLPLKFRELYDSNRILEARIYCYNNNNFNLAGYGLTITKEYNGRSSTEQMFDIVCYFMGNNDDAIVVIGRDATMPFIYRESTKDYDIFEIYQPTPSDKYYHELHLGKGANQHKIIITGKEQASSGKYRKYKAEFTTQSNGVTHSSSSQSGGNVIIAPEYNNGGGTSYGNSQSSKITCSRCGGSGICKSCGGSGGRVEYVDGYTGSGRRSFINCGECHGAKNCPICHGRGQL